MSRPETITSEYVRGFRAGESSALERAAHALESPSLPGDLPFREAADVVRALASPAAAPAAVPMMSGDGQCVGYSPATPSGPVAPSLLPRVLAAIESHPGEAEFGLAAELRQYIERMSNNG